MTTETLTALLDHLIAEWENEVIEFKRAGDGFSTSDIGKYFSALSNEANLRNRDSGWLVFGVDNNTRRVVGTDYRPEKERLQATKAQIADGTEPSITFRDIHELVTPEGRVILFQIPAAPRGLPIAWNGHYYARANESLTSLGIDKQDEIRAQSRSTDWSAVVVPEATLDHLDSAAVQHARDAFAKKYANRLEPGEANAWPLDVFLNKAKLAQDGKITRATLLLLGKAEAAHLLTPHPAQLTWKLEGPETAYEHFGPPFLLNTTALYKNIRNIQIRILPEDELLPVEVSKYDQRIVLEALHNCIAHQDYTRNGRVVVIEKPDCLIFENEGSFFEGQPEDYVVGHKTPRRYRNPFLVQAMTELNMIDTIGSGIRFMHREQAARYFPMPDYHAEPDAVSLTVHGRVVDPAYSRLLIQNSNLALEDILGLDRIQKRLPVSPELVKHLRQKGLIEGRAPNFHVSAAVARATAAKAAYIRTRAQTDAFYAKLLTDYLTQFGKASRKDVDDLLLPKLSDGLTEVQKRFKISNLLTGWRKAGLIENVGSNRVPSWVLISPRGRQASPARKN